MNMAERILPVGVLLEARTRRKVVQFSLDELLRIHAENKEYLKFLIGEAKSNSDFLAPFTGKSGSKWVLRLDPATGDLHVETRAT